MEPTLAPVIMGLFLTLVDSKGTFYGNPYRYNLYKAGLNPHYSPDKPLSQHKNHCAYVVQRNITCAVQDGVATYVKAEYTTKCIWGQKCPVLLYRTYFKPKYKTGQKMVTELEWRCCPGFSGVNCLGRPMSGPDAMMPPFKGSIQGPGPGINGYPHTHPRGPTEHMPITGSGLEMSKPLPFPHSEGASVPTGHLPSGDHRTSYGPQVDVSTMRLDRMEEDLRRLSQGMDTLNGLVNGLEDRLRVSLRENITKMLSALLGSPPRLSDSSVGFGVLDGGEGFPGLAELVGSVTEVKDELHAKSAMLDEIHGMVIGHEGQLKRLAESATGRPIAAGLTLRPMEELLDVRLDGMKAEFDKRLTSLEIHCDEKIGQVQQECCKEQLSGVELRQEGREAGLREELEKLQVQVQALSLSHGGSGRLYNLEQRVLLLEETVKGLTESQRQLQLVLTEQTLHMESLLDVRLLDMEGRLNISERSAGGLGLDAGSLDGFKVLLDDKLKSLEERLVVAVEELSNATVLLEGHMVPSLDTEIENMRQRVEANLDSIQKQLTDLELQCTSTCAVTPGQDYTRLQPGADEVEKKVLERLDTHADMLVRLNRTLQGVVKQLTQDDQQDELQGEITLLKINVNSVNRTLKGLRDSVHLFAREVGHTNTTWREREQQLAWQVRGVAKQVGRQAALLGTGERRLIQLKGELRGMRQRLESEMQGCRGTALGAQRDVAGVENRVVRVEGQCGGLAELVGQLEKIRAELESHSDSYLVQVNDTLVSHTQQLEKLKEGLQECVSKTDAAGQPDIR